ncbi:hypothetical protein V7124_16900 [Neobacillus niacini]|uniref:hypothetical protein n=1 Tax=Neobacillus niacini TaxID=86668 RepID=UPI002FFEB2CB
MHFRQFLISVLMAGAAMFFPDLAFAEKNVPSSQKGEAAIPVKSEKEEIKIAVPPKSQNANLQEKAASAHATVTEKSSVPEHAAVPEHAQINKAEAKQQTSKSIPIQAGAKNLPDQAKGNVKSDLNENEKILKETGTETAAVNSDSQGLKDKSMDTTSLSATNKVVKVEEAKPAILADTAKVYSEISVITKKESDGQEQKKGPANKEEIPEVNQQSQTQRSNSSGGQSNDRLSNGLSNISVLDKWFEWNNLFESNLVQPYISRQALLNTQWVNAPPAPPPQKLLY